MKALYSLQLIFISTIIIQEQSVANVPIRTPLDLSSIVLLKCSLQNDTMMDFFIKLTLNETTCPIKDCNSSIADVVQAAELHTFNTSFLANSTKALNFTGVHLYNAIKRSNVTVDSSLFYLNIFETTFSEIYDAYVSMLKNPATTIPNVLKILNVDFNSFLTELTFGTDATRLQILATGNYSLNNTKTIMEITNLTVTDMLSCLPLNKIAKNIQKVNSTVLSNFVNSLGITTRDIKNFTAALNVSSNTFVNYTNYATMLNNLDKYLNQDGALGVFTSRTEVVTSSRVILIQKSNTEFVSNYTTFYLQSLNTTTQYKVENASLKSGKFVDEVAILSSKTVLSGVPSRIGLIYNATKIFNCTYVTSQNGSLISENFSSALVDKTTLTIAKSNKTVFTLGSPIFCQNRMYGLAIENTSNIIRFTKFKTYNITVHPTRPTLPDAPDKNLGSFLYYDFAVIVFGIVIPVYFFNYIGYFLI